MCNLAKYKSLFWLIYGSDKKGLFVGMSLLTSVQGIVLDET